MSNKYYSEDHVNREYQKGNFDSKYEVELKKSFRLRMNMVKSAKIYGFDAYWTYCLCGNPYVQICHYYKNGEYVGTTSCANCGKRIRLPKDYKGWGRMLKKMVHDDIKNHY